MADVPFWLYDTLQYNTAAGVTHTLFQVAQGGDSTHTRQFTNMRASGQLPQNEKFIMRAIHAVLWNAIPDADLFDVFDGCTLELTISDENLFRIPLVMCSSHNGYEGVVSLTAPSDTDYIGRVGMGLKLDPMITLMGGDSFRVDVFQQNAFAVTDNIWIILEGVLSR